MSEPLEVELSETTPPPPVLTVDYADVLRQAVENERWKVLREVTKAVTGIAVKTKGTRSWDLKDRTATEYQNDLLAALERMEH